MKFYCEETKQLYDTQEECQKAQKEYFKKQEECRKARKNQENAKHALDEKVEFIQAELEHLDDMINKYTDKYSISYRAKFSLPKNSVYNYRFDAFRPFSDWPF